MWAGCPHPAKGRVRSRRPAGWEHPAHRGRSWIFDFIDSVLSTSVWTKPGPELTRRREAAKRGRGLAKSPFRQAQGPERSRKGSQSHEPNRFHRRERRDRRETTASHSSFTCGVKMGARSNAFQSSAFVLFAFLAVIEMPKSGSSARLRELRGLRVLHLAHASGYTDPQSEIANRK
jgi:hypothetical protein